MPNIAALAVHAGGMETENQSKQALPGPTSVGYVRGLVGSKEILHPTNRPRSYVSMTMTSFRIYRLRNTPTPSPA